MIVNPRQLECMQVYPDRGLMPHDIFDREEEQVLCGYCHEAWIDGDIEACEECLQALKEGGAAYVKS